jgi:hypothetical protein
LASPHAIALVCGGGQREGLKEISSAFSLENQNHFSIFMRIQRDFSPVSTPGPISIGIRELQ